MKKLLLVFVMMIVPMAAIAGRGEIGLRWWDRNMCVTFDHCEEFYRLEINLRVNVLPEEWTHFEFAPIVQNFRVRSPDQNEPGHATPIVGWFGFEAVWKPIERLRIALGGTSEHFFDGRVDTYNDGNGHVGRVGNYLDMKWDF